MMSIDSGWVAAIASLASAFVVAVTAIVAYLQLRHFRNANEIVVYLRLVDHMDSPDVIAARAAVVALAEKLSSDPEYRARLADPAFIPPEFRAVANLLRYLEHIAVLVSKGGVAEPLILAEYADIFVSIWDNLRPAIVQRRVALGPHIGRAFEHLAMRSRHYIDSGQMAREYDALERDTRPLAVELDNMRIDDSVSISTESRRPDSNRR